MAERKNTGLAVPNAKRLNDCFHELSEAIAARPAARGDRDLWQHDYAALPDGPGGDEREAWNHRCGSQDVALIALRDAVANGNLQLWTFRPQGEVKVDRYELKELTFRTFRSGTYQPDNRLSDSAGLADTALWVKEADWHRFMANLWAVRYGIDWANPAPPADKPSMPPEAQFVTLSHALTWIAFGVSMGNDHLHEVLSQDRYGEHNPQEAVTAALEKLLVSAGRERIALRGKYRADRDDDGAKLDTSPIEPIKFDDYRQFSYLEDELRHGAGLLFWHDSSGQVFHDVFGGGRKDAFVQVTVNRAELLREFCPHGPMGWEPEAIHWSDLTPSELERAGQLAREAEADEWWNWPQAAIWVGCRSLEHVATMRLCAEPWRGNGYDPAVALGAEHHLGTAYCSDPVGATEDLQRAIERGEIRTLGRATEDSPSHELKPLDWRGGKVVYNRTATLVSATNLLTEWACDVAVNRADLWTAFPAESFAAQSEPAQPEAKEARLAIVDAPARKSDRAPSVKAGHPPSDDAILAKADEMKTRGMDGRTIAKEMRREPGFENVATTAVRDLIKGRWKPAGRPKKPA